MNFSMNSKMENIQDGDIKLQEVHSVLYIFILAFIFGNFVTLSVNSLYYHSPHRKKSTTECIIMTHLN